MSSASVVTFATVGCYLLHQMMSHNLNTKNMWTYEYLNHQPDSHLVMFFVAITVSVFVQSVFNDGLKVPRIKTMSLRTFLLKTAEERVIHLENKQN